MPRKPNAVGLMLLAIVAATAPSRAARAVVVLKKGSETPLMGHLIRSDERAVVIRQELADDQTRDVIIPRSEIDEVLETVSPERLAQLKPSQPAAYFEYAEELAEKRRDPEARDAARRLLAITASRGDAAIRHSSLLLLADLARTDFERRRVEALLYLNDPRHDTALLRSATAASPASDPAAHAELLSAIRLIRQGQAAAAKSLLDKKSVQEELARANLPIKLADLTSLAGERALKGGQLATVLRAELALQPQRTPSSQLARWSRSPSTFEPLPPLSLDTVTEFDPHECLYKDGKWQRP